MTRQAFDNMLYSLDKDLYNFCRKLTLCSDEADDLYQDTIIKAYELYNKIDDSNNPKSFIISIAIGLWKNHVKKERRKQKYLSFSIFPDNNSCNIVDVSVNLEENCIKKEEQVLLLNKIKMLDYKYRIVLILFYYHHYSQKEIASMCCIPIGTVKSRLYKAKKQLRNKYLRNK